MGVYKAVDADQLEADLTTVADALRAKSGSAELLSFPDGMAAEADAVFEAGKEAGQDAFWEDFQQGGERYDYSYAFSGPGWTNVTFKPKYNIKPVGHKNAWHMFSNTGIADLRPDAVGVNIDFSSAVNANYLLSDMPITQYVGVVDVRNSIYNAYIFNNSPSLKYVEKLIISASPTTSFGSNCFKGCTALEHIIIEGTVSQTFDMQWCPLSGASIESVIASLSAEASGQTVSLNEAAVNTAFETSDGAADGSESEEWLALTATKSNWTISLV